MAVPVPGEQPLLSVLVATLARREDRFLYLLGRLLLQAETCPVEVVALQNNGGEPIANYRDRLLQAARGRYLCFVDDDDMVPDNYCEKVTDALASGPDCVGFYVVCSGPQLQRAVFSLTCQPGSDWTPGFREGQWQYQQEFSPMMPVRTELARQAGFQGSVFVHAGEDSAYASKLLPLLRARGSREEFIPENMYHYIWSAGDTAQASQQSWDDRVKYAKHPKPYVASKCFRWCE